jgi:hypothetical protein
MKETDFWIFFGIARTWRLLELRVKVFLLNFILIPINPQMKQLCPCNLTYLCIYHYSLVIDIVMSIMF